MAKNSNNPNPEQLAIDLPSTSVPSGPVECLGMTFPSDDKRRNYFLEKLAEKLKDPEFRKIEGFPIGEDEDILALSDPPYYTACPNPWLADFVKQYGRPYLPKEKYHRKPFAADVSEGKTHPIYSAHTYHTKVPHRAIMRYILHYTNPGDLVYDGFAGTGMTGVAAQLCGNREEVQALGYRVQKDGTILNEVGKPFSKFGVRRAILNDLSPAVTLVASNYSALSDIITRRDVVLKAIDQVEIELKHLYLIDNRKVINGVWSDVFICPHCSKEIVYWEVAISNDKITKSFRCPSCDAMIGKASSKADGAVKMERAFVATLDPLLNKVFQYPKFVLVEETATSRASKNRIMATSSRDSFVRTMSERFFSTVPIFEFEKGRQTNKLINGSGIRFLHQMYSPRSLAAYAALWAVNLSDPKAQALLRFCLSGINNYISRKQGYFGGGGGVAGTLFTPSIHLERNVFDVLRRKLNKLPSQVGAPSTLVSCQSASGVFGSTLGVVDYIFVDPPFGENFQYAELNSFVEAWLGVRTSSSKDCVLNYVHKKDLRFYSSLMRESFSDFYNALKPCGWMTVEFSNTQAAVWNAIQTALQEAGFVVANVSFLDKKQLQFNAINNPVSVKQDLVISAYKPNGGLEDRFAKIAETEAGVWDFVRTHLRNLPVVKPRGGQLEPIVERDPRILFDRTVAFYVRHSTPVPISSPEFQAGLAEKFPERDGMYFLSDQAVEYDKVRIKMEGIGQLSLFVEDERSAVAWLRNYLKNKPCKYQDIQPVFFEQLNQSWKKWETRPELRALLDQYFLCYSGEGDVPPQIHSYLSTNFKELRNLPADHALLRAKARDRWFVPDPRKNADVEQLREKRLLEEFWAYMPPGYEPAARRKKTQPVLPGMEPAAPKIVKGKRIAIVRSEAVRVGFNFCFAQNDYQTIIAVARHIPESVIQNDEQLQMIYDSAVTRTGGEFE